MGPCGSLLVEGECRAEPRNASADDDDVCLSILAGSESPDGISAAGEAPRRPTTRARREDPMGGQPAGTRHGGAGVGPATDRGLQAHPRGREAA